METPSTDSVTVQIKKLFCLNKKLVIIYPQTENKIDMIVTQALSIARSVHGRCIYIVTPNVACHRLYKECLKSKTKNENVEFLSTHTHPCYMVYHRDNGKKSKIFLHSIRHPRLHIFGMDDMILTDGGLLSTKIYEKHIYMNFFFHGGLRRTVYLCETDTLECEDILREEKYHFATIKAV